jgi:hypothetical protein
MLHEVNYGTLKYHSVVTVAVLSHIIVSYCRTPSRRAILILFAYLQLLKYPLPFGFPCLNYVRVSYSPMRLHSART